MQRPIIEIDEEKCDGCGQCVLDCAEGALAVIDGKARLISEIFCDGLGACLNCPRGALRIVTREAPAFDEEAALAAKAAREGRPAGTAGGHGCPGSAPRRLTPLLSEPGALAAPAASSDSPLAHTATWPLQLRLVTPSAPYLRGARLLLAAHCAGFCLPDLHRDWLPGRVALIACPKLDDSGEYLRKLTDILAVSAVQDITVLRMSVPCCGGLDALAQKAMAAAGVQVPLHSHTVRLG